MARKLITIPPAREHIVLGLTQMVDEEVAFEEALADILGEDDDDDYSYYEDDLESLLRTRRRVRRNRALRPIPAV